MYLSLNHVYTYDNVLDSYGGNPDDIPQQDRIQHAGVMAVTIGLSNLPLADKACLDASASMLLISDDRKFLCGRIRSAIEELTSGIGRVNLLPEYVQQPLIREYIRVECDLYGLSMPRCLRAYFLVGWIYFVAACIS